MVLPGVQDDGLGGHMGEMYADQVLPSGRSRIAAGAEYLYAVGARLVVVHEIEHGLAR